MAYGAQEEMKLIWPSRAPHSSMQDWPSQRAWKGVSREEGLTGPCDHAEFLEGYADNRVVEASR